MKKTYTRPAIKSIILIEDLMDSFIPIGSNEYDGELAKKHGPIIIDDEEEEEDYQPLPFSGI